MVCGLFINPVCMTKYASTFAIKPLALYGCNYTEAAGVSLFFAILVTILVILILILAWSFTGKALAVLFGILAFLGMLSTTISAYYQDSVVTALRVLENGEFSETYRIDDWSYSKEDWGKFYDACADYSSTAFRTCLIETVVPKAIECIDFQKKYRVTGIVVSCTLVCFVISPKPFTTIVIALLGATLAAVWALPIYATTVFLRAPDKCFIREYCHSSDYVLILAFGWMIPACLIIIGAFGACTCVPGIVIFALVLAVSCFGVVVPIIKLGRGQCKEALPTYHQNFIRTAIPQFIVAAVITLFLIASIISCLCGQPEAPAHVVRVIVVVG